MKRKIILMMVSSLALLAVAGCEKHTEQQSTPSAPPAAPGANMPGTNDSAPMNPSNTNNSAITNQ